MADADPFAAALDRVEQLREHHASPTRPAIPTEQERERQALLYRLD